MATSGSTNFTLTTSDLISDSLRLLDSLGIGETLSGEDYALGLRQLNILVKSWQAQGIHLWTETEGIVFTDAAQAKFVLGGSSPDKASEEDIKTELSVAASATATTINVDSSTGMAADDVVGIVQDNGTVHWSTITTVNSATSITITNGLASVAAADNHVYVYTTSLTRPLDVSSVRYRSSANYDTVLRKMGREEYFNLSNKDVSGVPSAYYFDRQRDNGVLYVYPVPADGTGRLMITFQRQIQDFDSSTDNPDVPVEWYETIVWNLALALSPFYGREDKAIKLAQRAVDLLQALKGWDSEHSSYKIR